MSTPVAFPQAWSLQDTQERLEQPGFPSKGTHVEQETWRREVGYPSDKKLALAIGRHMAFMMQNGVQVLPPYCEHVGVRVVAALRDLQKTPDDAEAQIEAGDHFVRQMAIGLCFFASKDETLIASQVHEKLLAAMEAGNFKFSPSDGGPCPLSGLELFVAFKGWQGIAATATTEKVPDSWRLIYHYTALTEGQVQPPGTQVAQIPMPTGELLIADWFRIPAFHDLTNVIDDARDHDIGTIEGRATRTRRYAAELGVAHIAAGSTAILQDNGVIKAGYLDVEAAKNPPNFKGEISANLRWTTMVDRGQLVEILTPALGKEEAERQVAEHIKQNPDIIKVSVAPGTHHLYFAGNSAFFGKTIGNRFAAEGLYLEDFEHPAFVLTQEPLAPATPAPERKSPRP